MSLREYTLQLLAGSDASEHLLWKYSPQPKDPLHPSTGYSHGQALSTLPLPPTANPPLWNGKIQWVDSSVQEANKQSKQ